MSAQDFSREFLFVYKFRLENDVCRHRHCPSRRKASKRKKNESLGSRLTRREVDSSLKFRIFNFDKILQ